MMLTVCVPFWFWGMKHVDGRLPLRLPLLSRPPHQRPLSGEYTRRPDMSKPDLVERRC